MSPNNFIKQNFALILGLALPALLVVFFFAAATLPRLFAQPPQYDALFVVTKYKDADRKPYSPVYTVEKDRLQVKLFPQEPSTILSERIAVYHPKTGTVEYMDINLDNLPLKKQVAVPEMKNVSLSTDKTAPDGYTLKEDGYNAPGIFMSGIYSNRSYYRLVKGFASHRLEGMENRDPKFLGWIIEGKIEEKAGKNVE